MAIPQVDTPMMRQFNAVKREHPDKLVFFRMGDFYEMFGEDAVVGARVLQIALTSRDKRSEQAVPMCGVPYKAYEQYLNKLTAAGYKVALCDQTENPAEAKGLVTREVVRIVTPGTTVSPQLIDPDRNRYLLALTFDLRTRRLGTAFADLSTGEFEIAEFVQDELPRLYDFLAQLDPQEILLAQSRSEAETRFLEPLTQRVSQLLSPCDLSPLNGHETEHQTPQRFQFVDPYLFDQDAARKRLQAHFQTLNLAGFGIEHLVLGTAAAGGLLAYLEETQKCNLAHLTSVRPHVFDQTMLLDEASVRNLELFETQSGNKRHTLFGVLDHTCTPMGARLLRQWIRAPLLDVDALNARLDAVAEFASQLLLCGELQTRLKGVQDRPRILGRISLPVTGVPDLVGLRESLEHLQTLPGLLAKLQCAKLRLLAEEFDPLADLLALLQTKLLETPSSKLREGGYIGEGVSEELDELRNLAHNSKQVLNEVLLRERERTGIPSLKISYNKVFGYYLEASNAHKASVPEDYIRKQTLVNAERYITPELKEFEEKILTAEERIGELEYELFLTLKSEIVGETARIQATAWLVAELDVFSGLATAAEHHGYVRPTLHAPDAPRILQLKGSRHPVIERIDLGEPFVPNDLELDETSRRIMLITGPNMAGKSTYMRQVALNVLMAQIGSFVPADSAELSLADRIFTRVGASDNLSLGQSTFMLEMNEAAAILHNATERSLVILDEIGRGTSTFDGISIAWAIVEHLHQLGALTLCATHYHELTALAKELNSVENFSVSIHEEGEQLVFMRKVVPGEADRSYGVQVAKLAGLPRSVVERALAVMTELEASSVAHRVPELAAALTGTVISPSEPEAMIQDSGIVPASPQLSLFPEEHPLLSELRKLDPDHLTPMQALTLLHDLVTQAKGKL
ncbi:MAG TPA: DNA mismatch repair protein MutS [Deltaproteobacteria bacterium]|nr:DNA mismatch repair protein MutS [Deltaproteobacteria bacterium]